MSIFYFLSSHLLSLKNFQWFFTTLGTTQLRRINRKPWGFDISYLSQLTSSLTPLRQARSHSYSFVQTRMLHASVLSFMRSLSEAYPYPSSSPSTLFVEHLLMHTKYLCIRIRLMAPATGSIFWNVPPWPNWIGHLGPLYGIQIPSSSIIQY